MIKIKTAADFMPGIMLSAFATFLLNRGHSCRSWLAVVLHFFQVRLLRTLEETPTLRGVTQGPGFTQGGQVCLRGMGTHTEFPLGTTAFLQQAESTCLSFSEPQFSP